MSEKKLKKLLKELNMIFRHTIFEDETPISDKSAMDMAEVAIEKYLDRTKE